MKKAFLLEHNDKHLRWALPFISVAVVTLIRLALDPILGSTTRFVLFLPAVALTSEVAGFWPGITAAGLSVLSGAFFFLEPRTSFYVDPFYIGPIIVFTVVAIIFCLLGQRSRKIRTQLQHTTDRFRAIFDKAGVGIAEIDHEGRFTAVNDSFCEIIGYSREELLQERVATLTAPEDRERSDALNRRLAMGEMDRYDTEKRYVRRDGRRVWVHLTVAAIRIPGETTLRSIGTIEDITERKHAQEQQGRLASIVESSDDAILSIDLDGTVRSWNAGAEQMFGYSREELIGRSVRPLTPPGREDELYEVILRLRSGQLVEREETLRRTKDGRDLEVWITASALKDDRGEVVGVSKIVRDITARRQYERTLQNRNEALALLFRAAGKLLAAKDPQAMVEELFQEVGKFVGADVFLNYMLVEDGPTLLLEASGGLDEEAQGRLCMLDIGQAICGTTVEMREPVYLPDMQNCTDSRAEHLRQIGVRTYAGFPLLVGERLLGVLAFGSRAKDEFSQTEREILETISSYVALAKDSVRSARALHEAATAKDQFLAALSHELRTPLTPVIAGLSLIEGEHDLPQEMRETLGIIRRNVGVEARLIDDLLDLTRIVRGKVSIERRPIILREVLERAVEVCRPDFDARKLNFNVDLANCGDRLVSADSGRLGQVFWNLLKNAVKFTPDNGYVEFSASCTPKTAVVKVKDSGVGIEKEALSRIFAAFEQANQAISRQFGGLGLGLAIAKRIVEIHGGTITVESAGRGQGACFTVTLPLIQAQSAEPPHEAYKALHKRILLVEDHGDTANMMRRVLEHVGHEVQTAGDFSQALSAASNREFDVLVSDLGLPDRSGLELMRELRREGKLLLGIALSGFGRDEDIREAKEAGFTEHIIKPVDPDALRAAVERVTRATA